VRLGNRFAPALPKKGAATVGKYVMLTKLTESGRKTVKKKPGRTNEVNKEVEAMGGRVLAQYAVLGPYDYVNIVEAPDNKTIAKISMDLGARGTMEIMTLAVVDL
jgi:uncharacterized protein with GYD domain